MAQRRILIGADHGGYALKEALKQHLAPRFQVEDVGTFDGKTADYPDIAEELANRLLRGQHKDEYQGGILLCGSGIGISIAANKIDGIRCALCHDHYTAMMCRKHNNANVIAMGGRTTGEEIAKEIVEAWLSSEFEGGHHVARIDKISHLETQ